MKNTKRRRKMKSSIKFIGNTKCNLCACISFLKGLHLPQHLKKSIYLFVCTFNKMYVYGLVKETQITSHKTFLWDQCVRVCVVHSVQLVFYSISQVKMLDIYSEWERRRISRRIYAVAWFGRILYMCSVRKCAFFEKF